MRRGVNAAAIRTFVAIALPRDLRDALTALTAALGAGRAVARDNLHLTLAFLDDQPPATLTALDDRLRDIAAGSFEIRIRGLDTFGARRPRVVFASVRPCDALLGLRGKVRHAAREAGIALPRERFRPHVTLARFSPSAGPGALDRLGRFLSSHGDFALPPARVHAFTLFRSRLTGDGAEHEALARYPLR